MARFVKRIMRMDGGGCKEEIRFVAGVLMWICADPLIGGRGGTAERWVSARLGRTPQAGRRNETDAARRPRQANPTRIPAGKNSLSIARVSDAGEKGVQLESAAEASLQIDGR